MEKKNPRVLLGDKPRKGKGLLKFKSVATLSLVFVN